MLSAFAMTKLSSTSTFKQTNQNLNIIPSKKHRRCDYEVQGHPKPYKVQDDILPFENNTKGWAHQAREITAKKHNSFCNEHYIIL